MMRRFITIAAVAAVTTAAHGQDQAAVIAKLRADLAAARETLATARATITELEARVDAIDVAPPPLARAERQALRHGGGSQPLDFTDVGEVDEPTATATRGSANTSIPPQTDSLWEYGPPGPIGLPLSPPGDEYAAGVELVAGSGSGVATFSITHSDDKPGTVLPDGSTGVVNDTLTLSASAPLAKDGTTPFATLDGLVTGTKISFGFTQFTGRVPSQESDDRDATLVAARARCVQASPAYEPGCVRLDDAFLNRFMSPDERRRYESNYAKASVQQSIAWSLRAALGYDDFDFYAQPSLTKKTVDRLGWSVGGALAAYPARGLATVVALDYQRSFKASEAVSTCPVPVSGQTTISCVPGPIDGPKRTDKLLLTPELRFLIPTSENGLVRSVGLGSRIEIDLLASELAFDLPIYLASDPKSGLTGGLRAGYVTKGDDFRLGIFVGKTFSLFK